MDVMSQFTFINMFFSKLHVLLLPIVLTIIILFLVFRYYLLKKNIIGYDSIKIQSKISIGPNESILIIDLKEVKLVLGVTSTCITHLYTLPSRQVDKKNIVN